MHILSKRSFVISYKSRYIFHSVIWSRYNLGTWFCSNWISINCLLHSPFFVFKTIYKMEKWSIRVECFSYRMIVNRVDHLKIGTQNNWLQGTLNGPCTQVCGSCGDTSPSFFTILCITIVLFILKNYLDKMVNTVIKVETCKQ